jgi:hypothetical protein
MTAKTTVEMDLPDQFWKSRAETAEAETQRLRMALRLLFEECVLSGMASAKDYGWPKAIAAARAALASNHERSQEHG